MSLFQSFLKAVRSWRRRRGGPKTPQRAEVTVERLDHRQLLSVNFTGNVATDFPATQTPGVVILDADANDQIAQPDANLASLIRVSGFAVNAVRVTYDPADDTLNFGLEQPNNQKTGRVVMAGDADNNGDTGTVDPAVSAIDPSFSDPPDLGGTETMAVFLDLNSDGVADIVAGKDPNDPSVPKPYQVALAIPSPIPGARPTFGAPLPDNTGNFYLVNSPLHPAFEFNITGFSGLFAAFNGGQAPTEESLISIGAFAGSTQDGSSSETFISFKTTPFGPTILPNPCPPLEPPVIINPHQHRHINTAHPTAVRVAIFGSAGFNVNQIVPDSVTLGGATPVLNLPSRRINRDKYPDKVFIFRGTDIDLPPGVVDAVVSGMLQDGTPFRSTFEVFNRDESFYAPRLQAVQEARRERIGPIADLIPIQRQILRSELVDRALGGARDDDGPATAPQGGTIEPVAVGSGPVVSIPMTHKRRHAAAADDNVVSIPTREGQSALKPRKLRVDAGRWASRRS
jgi:hypothetical protein